MIDRQGAGDMKNKCADCAFSVRRNPQKGIYILICTHKGAYKRPGDSCRFYCNNKELEELLTSCTEDIRWIYH